MDVGTDSREYDILGWTVKTGVLEGAEIPLIAKPLKPIDTAFNVLGTSVIGSILQHYVPVLMKPEDQARVKGVQSLLTPETESLKEAFIAPPPDAQPSYAYESRVLEGIWAAAPHLHNGSVPTLAELLKPQPSGSVRSKSDRSMTLSMLALLSTRPGSTIHCRQQIAAIAIQETAAAAMNSGLRCRRTRKKHCLNISRRFNAW